MPPTDQVNVQMKYALSRVGPNVEHRAVSVFDSAFPGDLRRDHVTIADEFGIARICFL